MTAPDKRSGKTGRWSSTYDVNALYPVVAEVARVADPSFPHSVSQRKWDDSRAAAGHPTAPSARQITTRLRLGWEDVKRIALDPDRNIEQTAAGLSKKNVKEERKRTPRELHYGLNRIAHEIGRRGFNRTEYARVRDELIGEEKRRLRDQAALARLIPSLNQIDHSVPAGQTWDETLISVGLEPYEPVVVKTALSPREAFDVFVDVFHLRPSRSDLDWMREQFGVSIAKFPVGTPFTELEAAWIAARSAEGLDTPSESMTKAHRRHAAIPADVLAKLPTRTVKGKNTYEVCVQALAEYLQSLGSDDRPSQRHYKRVSPAHGWPAWSALVRHAPWLPMLNAARVLLQTGKLVPIQTVKHQADDAGGINAQLSEGGEDATSASQSSGMTATRGSMSGSSRKQSRKAA